MKLGESAQRRQEKWAHRIDKRVKRRAAGKKVGLWVESAEGLPLAAMPASRHAAGPDWEDGPRAYQVKLSQEQIKRFETNRVNGVMVLAMVKRDDCLPEEALGAVCHYLADHEDKDRVIVSESAIAQNIRHLATVVVDTARLSRFEPAAQAYDFRGLGVSIPRDRIVDIDAPRISDENHSDQSSGQA